MANLLSIMLDENAENPNDIQTQETSAMIDLPSDKGLETDVCFKTRVTGNQGVRPVKMWNIWNWAAEKIYIKEDSQPEQKVTTRWRGEYLGIANEKTSWLKKKDRWHRKNQDFSRSKITMLISGSGGACRLFISCVVVVTFKTESVGRVWGWSWVQLDLLSSMTWIVSHTGRTTTGKGNAHREKDGENEVSTRWEGRTLNPYAPPCGKCYIFPAIFG